MSAYIVSEQDITALVAAGLRFPHPGSPLRFWPGDDYASNRELTHANASEVGQMLWGANYASVNARYDEADLVPAYTYPLRQVMPGLLTGTDPERHDPVVILKLIAHYEYQSCEHDGWATSDAKAFCDALRHTTINALPGYESAPWGL